VCSSDLRLSLGDGIEVWVSQGGRAAAVVRKMFKQGRAIEVAAPGDKVVIEIDGKIRPGDRCFKTRDDELLAKAQESYRSPRVLRKIGIDVSVSGHAGLPLEMTIVDEDGNEVSAITDTCLEYAQKRPITPDYMRDQIDRLGNSPFQLHGFCYKVDEGLIIPVSKINDARRKAIEELEALRVARSTRSLIYSESDDEFKRRLDKEVSLRTQTSFSKPDLVVTVDDIASGTSAILEGADAVGFDMESRKLSVESGSIKELARLMQEQDKEVGISLITPRIIKDGELKGIVAAIDGIAHLLKADTIVVRNLGLLQYLKDIGFVDFSIGLDYTLGIFNPQSLRMLMELTDMLQINFAAVSPELTMEQLKNFTVKSPLKIEALVHGTLTTMVSEHCFICSLAGTGNKRACGQKCENARYGLKDRTGAIFPISGDMGCRGHIANSRDLCMIDHIRDLCRAGIGRFRIEGWNKSSDYIRQVTRTYRIEIDRYWEAPPSYMPDQMLREHLEELSPYGITKGHYFRGVL
jgi:putative protease